MRIPTLMALLLGSAGMTSVGWAESPSANRKAVPSSATGKSETILVSGSRAKVSLGNDGNLTEPGGGLMRAETAAKTVQTVTRAYIAKQSPTANPQQLLQLTPGANVSMADPFGATGGQITVRGLPSTEMGWIFEGMPLNNVGSGAIYANEFVDAENLSHVTLTPGSANLDTPTTVAAGGVVDFGIQDPSHRFGGLTSFSYGSFNTAREFFRLETGDMGKDGPRALVSFSNLSGDNWRGPGGLNKKHVDFKIVKDFKNKSFISLVATYNDQKNQQYKYPTSSQFEKSGNNVNYDRVFKKNDTAYYKLLSTYQFPVFPD